MGKNVPTVILSVFLFVFVCATIVYAESPTDKGSYIVSGSVSYSNYDGGSDESYFSASPGVLYFFLDNLALGAAMRYSKLDRDYGSQTAYGIGPELRAYLNGDEIKPFLSIGYSYEKMKLEGRGYDVDAISRAYLFKIGADYFISKNVAMEPSISYSVVDSSYGSSGSVTVIGLGEDFNVLTIGIGITAFIF